jgi:general stress protein 26
LEAQPVENPTLHALVQRLAESDCCWFSSVRPDGRAHSVPIWHVWHLGRVYIITDPKSVKVANIRHHPAVVVTHPDPLNPIIVEGVAQLAPDRLADISARFQAKYDWDPSQDAQYGAVLEITPSKLMAWGKYGEGRWSGEDVVRIVLD